MKKLLLATIIISQLFTACSKSKNSDPVLISIENQTGFEVEEVFVAMENFENSNTYGNIKAGDSSPYKVFKLAYSYGYIKLYINKEEFIQQPIDFVGETNLAPGKHTLILKLLDQNDQRILRSTYRKD
ncbi:hypothetical protein [Daejeonella oryzae]|uniref:hypothetical protein n=1 Tax=Daejeonella oryzae TaxID=1122943 RepID=UPI00047D8CBC|nr:hypothetical protein [Daejeonella oryzae]